MLFENPRIEMMSIESMVKDVLIVFDARRIANISEMPRNGICFLTLERKINGLKVILEREVVRNLKNLQANQLSAEIRLLHNIVSHISFLKIGQFYQVTEKDIAFIYYLIEGKSINLPFLILTQIKEAVNMVRACLPQGIVFTLIFQEFGVDYSKEDLRRLLHINRYNERSLHLWATERQIIDGSIELLIRELLLVIVLMMKMMITMTRRRRMVRRSYNHIEKLNS